MKTNLMRSTASRRFVSSLGLALVAGFCAPLPSLATTIVQDDFDYADWTAMQSAGWTHAYGTSNPAFVSIDDGDGRVLALNNRGADCCSLFWPAAILATDSSPSLSP